jgi:hypothetical protein
MHFKNQRAIMVRRKGNVLEIKAFSLRRRVHSLRGTPESHPPDTDSRLLTELNRSRIVLTAVISTVKQRVQSREPRVHQFIHDRQI